MQPIQGLSKREQSKLERLMRDQAEKASNHHKSYRRRPSKGKNTGQGGEKKIFKTQIKCNQQGSEEVSSSIQEITKKHDSHLESRESESQQKKIPSHFNEKFPLKEGDEFFQYIMTYSHTQKGKFMDYSYNDEQFLQNLKGTSLPTIDSSSSLEVYARVEKKFNEVKNHIEAPFDDKYQQFLNDYLKSQMIPQ